LIERCIFIVCLDKPVQNFLNLDDNNNNNNNNNNDTNLNGEDVKIENETSSKYIEKNFTVYAHQMIHGCNSENNSGNRWFDKTMQFIISEDGVYGLNYEHSPAEGIVVIELSEHLFRYM
jgi:hypothetical protein